MDHRFGSGRTDDSVGKMECVHVQRIPSNTKVVLVADVDKDGANEMIIGLTDRVVRSYRWSSNADLGTGKLIGLNKWECANQIGTVTLQDDLDGTPTLLVAQPGGTFMRIKCNADDYRLEDDSPDTNNEAAASCIDYQTLGISRMRNPNISTEILGNLKTKLTNLSVDAGVKIISANEDVRKSVFPDNPEEESTVALDERNKNIPSEIDSVDGNLVGGNIIFGEFESKKNNMHFQTLSKYSDVDSASSDAKDSSVETESQKRAINLDSNVKEESRTRSNAKSYAIATLDGTMMLVKDEIILW